MNAIERVKELINELGCAVEVLRWDEDLKKYNERKKFTFPLYPDPKREVFSLFAEKSIPRSYLFGKDGKLLYSSIGYTAEEFQKLMESIEKAL